MEIIRSHEEIEKVKAQYFTLEDIKRYRGDLHWFLIDATIAEIEQEVMSLRGTLTWIDAIRFALMDIGEDLTDVIAHNLADGELDKRFNGNKCKLIDGYQDFYAWSKNHILYYNIGHLWSIPRHPREYLLTRAA